MSATYSAKSQFSIFSTFVFSYFSNSSFFLLLFSLISPLRWSNNCRLSCVNILNDVGVALSASLSALLTDFAPFSAKLLNTYTEYFLDQPHHLDQLSHSPFL
ncbi:hypothetical protein RND81_08G133300 [Saponaria officinalis]|uniref:Uncharacterized protein n=1 Tax=Saponaria officinalis TaxID=3572 RepID=A0AAW1J766_SAPOF